MDSFSICQWNCRSAISNKNNLEYILAQNKIEIALLSETWFKPGSVITFTGYKIVRQDRQDGRGGVAILVKSGVRFEEVKSIKPVEFLSFTAVSLKLKNGSFIHLVSVYVRPKVSISVQQWNQFIQSIPRPFILAGDFNAHHSCWGCEITDGYGARLLEAMNDSQLIYLNDGSPTLVKSVFSLNESAIDLTWCTADLAGLLEWKALDDPSGSDHFPIIIKATLSPRSTSQFSSRKWKIAKADWNKYFLEANQLFISEDMTYEDFLVNVN